jgi:branched-chain amino acid transport system permease protein/urea transport system permease protein
MSLSFVWGQVGLLCFGQAIFFGVGAYAMALITKGMVPALGDGMLMGLVAATLLPGVIALMAGFLMFRGRGLSGAYFAIVTLAAAAIVERGASHWKLIGGFNGLLKVPPLRYGFGTARAELLDAVPVYYVLLVAAAAVYAPALAGALALGTALRAVRDNEQRTSYFGFDNSVYKTASFAVSGCVAGLPVACSRPSSGSSRPLIGVPLSTEVLI